MVPCRFVVALCVVVSSACGGKVVVDDSGAGGTGGALGGGGATSTASSTNASVTSTGTGSICPSGTCVVQSGGPCEPPTGPTGNGCCGCDAQGACNAFCKCASPETPIATPDGERPIASLAPGDLVYSVDHERIAIVPIRQTHRSAVLDHRVVRVRLANGSVLEISGSHPTADGRTFDALRPGGSLDGVAILEVEEVPYRYPHTYDVLPDSDTGDYFAGGVRIGSTLEGSSMSLELH